MCQLTAHKAHIENMKADREALRKSLKEKNEIADRSNKTLADLRAELGDAQAALRLVTEERELALLSVGRSEKNMAEQQEAFCVQVKELESKLMDGERAVS